LASRKHVPAAGDDDDDGDDGSGSSSATTSSGSSRRSGSSGDSRSSTGRTGQQHRRQQREDRKSSEVRALLIRYDGVLNDEALHCDAKEEVRREGGQVSQPAADAFTAAARWAETQHQQIMELRASPQNHAQVDAVEALHARARRIRRRYDELTPWFQTTLLRQKLALEQVDGA